MSFRCFCFVGGGRFYDPRTKQSFKYDHLRKEACEYQTYESDALAESWRAALDIETIAYTANHYRHGVASVFGRSSNGQITLSICIEDHQFQPKNFWNGRWRSQWHVTFVPGSNNAAELKGTLRAQVNDSWLSLMIDLIQILVFDLFGRFTTTKTVMFSWCRRKIVVNR